MNIIATDELYGWLENDEDFNLFVGYCLTMFGSGDWGDISERGRSKNEEAVKNGLRLVGTYPIPAYIREKLPGKDRIWIVREGDGSRVTIAFSLDAID